MPLRHLCGISGRFHPLFRTWGQVAYVLLTRSPLTSARRAWHPSVRLACIKHAASVHPEPGSNSPFDDSIIALHIPHGGHAFPLMKIDVPV